MWHNGYGWGMFGWGPLGFGAGIVFALAVIWSVAWKGLALWRAAREESKGWFVALLVINTFGILEILYLYVFSKPSSPAHSEHHSHSSSSR